MELSEQEKKAIQLYQKYKKMLGNQTSLSSYWVGIFEGNYDELVKYLKNLRKYIKLLDLYVSARQYHYEKFIKDKKFEDPPHRIWRKNLKLVLKDAQEKYEYYSNIEKKQFYEFKSFSVEPNILISCPVDCEEEMEERNDHHVNTKQFIVSKLTKREINRRKKLKKKLKKQKEMEERLILNKTQKSLNINLHYNFSLNIMSIIKSYMKHGVILIDPVLYFEKIVFTGDRIKASRLIKSGVWRNKLYNVLIDYITKDPCVRTNLCNYYLNKYLNSVKNLPLSQEYFDNVFIYARYFVNYQFPSKYDELSLNNFTEDNLHNLKISANIVKLNNIEKYKVMVDAMNKNVIKNLKFVHNFDKIHEDQRNKFDIQETSQKEDLEIINADKKMIEDEAFSHAINCDRYYSKINKT